MSVHASRNSLKKSIPILIPPTYVSPSSHPSLPPTAWQLAGPSPCSPAPSPPGSRCCSLGVPNSLIILGERAFIQQQEKNHDGEFWQLTAGRADRTGQRRGRWRRRPGDVRIDERERTATRWKKMRLGGNLERWGVERGERVMAMKRANGRCGEYGGEIIVVVGVKSGRGNVRLENVDFAVCTTDRRPATTSRAPLTRPARTVACPAVHEPARPRSSPICTPERKLTFQSRPTSPASRSSSLPRRLARTALSPSGSVSRPTVSRARRCWDAGLVRVPASYGQPTAWPTLPSTRLTVS